MNNLEVLRKSHLLESKIPQRLMTYLYAVLFVSTLLIPSMVVSHGFADTSFYLIDSLILEELIPDDQLLLDSCLTFYHNSKYDTNRVKAFNGICENMVHDVWEKYQQIQLTIIKQSLMKNPNSKNLLTLKKSLAGALNNMGLIHKGRGDISESTKYFYKSLKLYKALGNKKELPYLLCNLGGIQQSLGEVDSALSNYREALKLFNVISNKRGKAGALRNMSGLYSQLGDISKALLLGNYSLKLYMELQDEMGIANMFNNIGTIYSDQSDKSKAMDYYKKSKILYKQLGFKVGVASAMNNIGSIYKGLGNYNKALSYHKSALPIYREAGSIWGEAVSLNNIGSIYDEKDDLNQSLVYYFKSLGLLEKVGQKEKIANVLVNIGEVYYKQNKLIQAHSKITESMKLSLELGYPENIKNAALMLSRIYEGQNRPDLALKMHKKYLQMKDSLDHSGFMRDLAKHENKYVLDKKNTEMKLLSKEKQLEKQRFIIYMILMGLCIVFLSGVFYILQRKKRIKYEEELGKLRALKIEAIEEKSANKKKSILIKRGRKLSSMELTDVICFKADNNYVLLIDKTGVSYVVDYTLSKLEEQLPKSFVRVHRSSIINAEKIKLITKGYRGKHFFTMEDKSGTKIDSSKTYSQNVKVVVNEFESSSL